MSIKLPIIASYLFLIGTLCTAASAEDDSEKLKIAVEIKGHNIESKSQHELRFDEHELIKSLNTAVGNQEFFVELTPKRLSAQKLGETSSFLVELNISRKEGKKQVSIARPLLSVEYGGQTKIQQKVLDGNEHLEVSILSLR